MVAGVAVLAVGVVAPWAVGYVTEQQWQSVATEVSQSQPLFRLETGDYDRGYLGADFTGTITVRNPETGNEHEFDYQARVSHGVTGSLMDFSLPSEAGTRVEEIFPDEKPKLTLETRLWGTALIELSIPAVSVLREETGESFDMSESYTRADISGNGAHADILMLWPGAVIRAPDLRISIEDFRLEQTLEHLAGEVWLGDGDMSLARLEVAARNEPVLRFDQFALRSETTADDDGQSLDSETLVTLESVTADDESFGPHRMAFVFNGLEVQSWSELTSALTDMQTAALDSEGGDSRAVMQQQMESMNRINQAMLGLAADGFSLGFPEMSFATPYGPVNGEIMVEHPPVPDEEKDRMMMVMQRLTGNLEVSMPLALVEQHPELGMQVAPLIKQGVVEREGGRLRMKGTLEDLALDINGNLIPLPPLF
ncbi:DUF945 domain-containing protein [Marinobacter orientalis]|uniref:DUF945 family protein n=2 Tax=Marinobacter orientalis TaxID=1928859 RepID=A0A7Y0RAR8_9GAMM|nr:DUF945 family protein [Marinobacter orientalis]TGX52043.1 DUF945 domain-containing protein [Marinobacter orientalis]